MSHLTDARDIIFADPADMDTPDLETSLDVQIEYAEWLVEVAIANLEASIDERAAFDLKVAIEHLNDLTEKRDARDTETASEQLELEFGALAIESDKHDKAIAEGGF